MRVHHLNCGSLRTFGGRLIDGEPGVFRVSEQVMHCLLIETDDGLVLIDTATGMQGVSNPRRWLGTGFQAIMRPFLRAEDTAVRQVEKLGFSRDDVRHIIPTHLDLDHAGGLADFPAATVHVFDAELSAALHPGRIPNPRFRQQQFAHGPRWHTYREEGEKWEEFDGVMKLAGLPEDILLVPLHGHTPGHAGIAVRTGDRWLLHAGDAYMHHGEVDPTGSHCPALLKTFQTVLATSTAQRAENLARLQHVNATRDDVTVFCAHSAVELQQVRQGQAQ